MGWGGCGGSGVGAVWAKGWEGGEGEMRWEMGGGGWRWGAGGGESGRGERE